VAQFSSCGALVGSAAACGNYSHEGYFVAVRRLCQYVRRTARATFRCNHTVDDWRYRHHLGDIVRLYRMPIMSMDGSPAYSPYACRT